MGTFRCVLMHVLRKHYRSLYDPSNSSEVNIILVLFVFSPIVSSSDAVKLLLAGGVPQHQSDVLTVQTDNNNSTVTVLWCPDSDCLGNIPEMFASLIITSSRSQTHNYQLTIFASPESPPRWFSCIQQ